MATPSLKEYLKKYSSDEKPKSKSNNKRKKPHKSMSVSVANKINNASSGVRIVDEDPLWQTEIKDDSNQEDSPDEKPQVTEDVEVKRMKRLEHLTMHRPYLTVADDGSGWVTVSETKKAGIHSNDLSPERQSSVDVPHDRHVQCTYPDQSLSPPRRDQSNIHQRDLLPANKRTNFESGNLSPDSNYHEPHHSLLQEHEGGAPNPLPPRKVRHDSPDLSPPRNAWTKSADLSPPRKCQKDTFLEVKDREESPALHNDSFLSRMPHHETIGRRGEYPNRNNFIPSPQRKVRHDSPDLTPPRKPWTKYQDLSPPRKPQNISPNKRDTNESSLRHDSRYSLPARVSEYEDRDPSPPSRTRQHSIGRRGDFPSRHNLTPSPKRKVRHDSPDLSPRRKADTKFQDLSPPRKTQKGILTNKRDHKESPFLRNSYYSIPATVSENEEQDSFPPRSAWHDSFGKQEDSSNGKRFIPPHGKGQRVSPDLSPSRYQKDISPHKKDINDSSICHRSHYSSPGRTSKDDERDSSPLRRIHHSSSGRTDDSLTRKRMNPSTRMPEQSLSERHVMDRSRSKGEMTDGTNAGLRTGRDLKEEIDQKKREESHRFLQMDPSISGRGAETVYRDKQGKRLEGVEEFLHLQQGQPKPEDKPLEWGKGLTQKREAEARQAALELEKNKPFARSRDDPELDKMLKERVRWGDPMAHLVKRKNDEPVLENLAEDEKIRESGFIIPQDIPSHSWLKRGVDPPANRYGIKPGRHWDGVDRSNGFERGLFKRKNEKLATETEAYLWSVADM